MEIFLLLIAVILLIILVSNKNESKAANDRIIKMLSQLNKELLELKQNIKTEPKVFNENINSTKDIEVVVAPKPELARPVEKYVAEIKKEISIAEKMFTPNYQQRTEQKSQPILPQPQESWFTTWLKNNPDIEKFIGENLVNKIGIGILVLGIAFFVKYAIDQDWIKEGGRVAIGMLCGAILIGIAHWLKNSYRSFSSVLVGGGIAIFYFTIAFAFHQYAMMGKTTAFIEMVAITVFAIAISIYYNRVELAIIATIGGFVAPFLVTDGNGNYVVLFTYLIILNAGIIALAYFKKWRVLQIIAFAFTTIIYNGWLFSSINTTKYNAPNAIGFAIIFYIMFVAMSLLHHVKQRHALKAIDFSIFLLINLTFFGIGIYILDNSIYTHYKGLFTACSAVVNLLLSLVLYKQKLVDKNLVSLLIGLAVSFTSLIAPIQLNGNYITLFWFAEMVLLFWFYQKSSLQLFKLFSVIITVFAGISLVIDWIEIYENYSYNLIIIFNKGFITTAFAATAMWAMQYFLNKEANTFYFTTITTKTIKRIYKTAIVFILFVGGLIEVNHQFSNHYNNTGINVIYSLLYVYSFIIGLYFVFKNKNVANIFYNLFGVTIAMFLLYIIAASSIYNTLQQMVLSNKNQFHFVGYIICVGALLFLFTVLIKELSNLLQKNKGEATIFYTLIIAQFVVIISVFTYHIYVWTMLHSNTNIVIVENNFERAGLSIVWGLASFVIMFIGMRKQMKPLRIIALSLFAITLVKLFLYDITNMSEGGKIAAFILLGVLLLIISFMYQRLKKILIDDTVENK